jgi:hypothetical protein
VANASADCSDRCARRRDGARHERVGGFRVPTPTSRALPFPRSNAMPATPEQASGRQEWDPVERQRRPEECRTVRGSNVLQLN